MSDRLAGRLALLSEAAENESIIAVNGEFRPLEILNPAELPRRTSFVILGTVRRKTAIWVVDQVPLYQPPPDAEGRSEAGQTAGGSIDPAEPFALAWYSLRLGMAAMRARARCGLRARWLRRFLLFHRQIR